jgi:hypothetical protein
MDKIVSKSYSDRGRQEHERIFGDRKVKYADKMLVPGDERQRGTFEVKT